MIVFRPMRADEFPVYLEYFIPDYAREIAANYGLSADTALARARREIDSDLKLGADTPGQVLLCIVNDESETDAAIGYLWYKPDEEARTVFISDFHIFPAHQGNGYGKMALNALGTMLVDTGFDEIRLRVAADNKHAQHIYSTVGFRTTGVNMSRRLEKA